MIKGTTMDGFIGVSKLVTLPRSGTGSSFGQSNQSYLRLFYSWKKMADTFESKQMETWPILTTPDGLHRSCKVARLYLRIQNPCRVSFQTRPGAVRASADSGAGDNLPTWKPRYFLSFCSKFVLLIILTSIK